MIPENSVEIHELEPIVSKLSDTLQENGYFGYVTFDFYSYRRHQYEKLQLLVIDIHPYYSHVQHFIDWVKFAISGSYNKTENTIDSNAVSISENNVKHPSFDDEPPFDWNSTMERYAIGIAPLTHSSLSFYLWSKLKSLSEECGVSSSKIILIIN